MFLGECFNILNKFRLGGVNEHKNENYHVELIHGRTIDKLTDVEPIYNNQNTILMVAFKEHENKQLLLVVHETRIFFFSPMNSPENERNIRKSAETLISEIIGIILCTIIPNNNIYVRVHIYNNILSYVYDAKISFFMVIIFIIHFIRQNNVSIISYGFVYTKFK